MNKADFAPVADTVPATLERRTPNHVQKRRREAALAGVATQDRVKSLSLDCFASLAMTVIQF